MKPDLNIYYQNVRGLRTRVDEINIAVLSSNYDIIVLTETWLHAGIRNEELIDNRYIVHRKDRDYETVNQQRGGGVLIAVKTNIFSERIIKLESDDKAIEHIWVKLKTCNSSNSIYLGAFYFPPNTTREKYRLVYEKIMSNYTILQNDMILIGDFNVPDFNSSNDQDNYMCTGTSPRASDLQEFIQICCLQSLNHIHNHMNRTLDLVLTNIAQIEVNLEESLLSAVDTYHPPLFLTIQVKTGLYANQVHKSKHDELKFLNYSRANFLSMYCKFQKTDWSPLYTIKDSCEAAVYFSDIVHDIILATVPLAMKKNKNSYPPWFTREVFQAIKEKEKYRAKYKRTGNPTFLEKFQELRRKAKRLIRRSKRVLEVNIETKMKEDPKKFWTYVNEKRKQRTNSNAYKYNGNNLYSPQDIADAFAEHFSSVFSESSSTFSSGTVGKTKGDVQVRNIQTWEVEDALNKLKPKRTLGPDGVPQYIYKACKEFFIQPLTYIFNLILQSSKFPSCWKVSKITPIPKNNQLNEIVNYRPISILPVPAKVFETIMHRRIYDQIRSQISDSQHGFIEGRSVVTNLVSFVQYTSYILDQNSQIDTVYTDFQKAFDKVDHQILISKIIETGFSEPLTQLFTSYFSNRKQYVDYKGSISKTFTCTSGVPQGSILGPLLFLIFINDITHKIKYSRVLLYADDLKLFRQISEVDDRKYLQLDLDALVEWSKANNLPFNVEKCFSITYTRKVLPVRTEYTIDNCILQQVSENKDLGVILDSKLSFKNHINYMVKKSRSMLGFLMRNSVNFTNVQNIQTLYYSLVRSHLEYASVVWNPRTAEATKSIENVQKRFLRYLYYKQFGYYSYDIKYQELLQGYVMKSLRGRRNIFSLIFLHDLIHYKKRDPELLETIKIRVPTFNSRSTNIFTEGHSRTHLLSNAPLNRVVKLYNDLINIHHSLDILDGVSKSKFKTQLYHLLQ